MQPDQRCQVVEACSALYGFFSQDKGFIVASESLEDGRPLTAGCFGIEAQLLGLIDVGQSIFKSMKSCLRSRTSEQRLWVRGPVAYELFRNLLCPVIICNATEDQPAQRDQLGETRSSFDACAAIPDLRLQGVDLGFEIQQSNRAVGERAFVDHDLAASGRLGGAM